MAKVEFLYDGQKIDIYCNENDKFNNIIIKYSQKVQKNKDDLCFLYGGQVVNVNTTFNGLANSIDKKRKIISIIATNNYAGNNSNLILENKQLKEKLTKAYKTKDELKAEIQELKYKISMAKSENMNQINNLMNTIEQKDEEIKKLNMKLKNKDLSDIIAINFISRDGYVRFPISCKGDQAFYEVEEKLYQNYPEYKGKERLNSFFYNGNLIERSETISENKIKDGSTILMDSLKLPQYIY